MHSWAVIFDWDGVIVDSSRQHEMAWQRLAKEEDRSTPPGFFPRSFGMKNDKVISELLGWTTDRAEIQRLSDLKEQMFRDSIRQQTLQPLPGVRTFLEGLRTAAIPCAVASSTPRENISCVLEGLRLEGSFQAMVCAEDVTRGKPDPEVFLMAAKKLSLPPESCVVFEDAHVGIEAALKAGSKVVGVATTHPAESLQGAHWVVRRLDELSVAELATWFGNGRFEN